MPGRVRDRLREVAVVSESEAVLAVALAAAPPLVAYAAAVVSACAVTLTRPVHNAILPELAVTATDFEFTFARRDDSLAPETQQTFQFGSDLSGWTPIAIPTGPGVISVPPATVTVTPGTPADTVKVSIPKTSATDGRLFGRLRVFHSP